MGILSKYILVEFSKLSSIFLLSAITLLAAVLSINQIFQKDISASTAFKFTLYQMPEILVNTIPIICLLGGMSLLSALSRRNELMILFTSGISTQRLLSILIIPGIIVSFLIFFLINWLLPPIAMKRHHFKRTVIENKAHLPSSMSKDRVWYKSANAAYSFQGFNVQRKFIYNFSIYDLSKDFNLQRNIEAKKAYYDEDGYWHLEDTIFTYFSEKFLEPQVHKYARARLPLKDYPVEFEDINLKFSTLSLSELWGFVLRNKKIGIDTSEQEILFWKKLSLIFLPIVMLILAVLLKIKNFQRQSIFKDISLCFIATIVYFLINSVFGSIARMDFVPIFLAAFMPGFLLLVFGAAYFFLQAKA